MESLGQPWAVVAMLWSLASSTVGVCGHAMTVGSLGCARLVDARPRAASLPAQSLTKRMRDRRRGADTDGPDRTARPPVI
jgi:hypothetical protein